MIDATRRTRSAPSASVWLHTAVASAAVALMVSFPRPAYAHVKWFADAGAAIGPGINRFSVSEPAVQIAVAVAMVCIFAAALLEKYLGEPPQHLARVALQHGPGVAYIFQAVIGIGLIVTAINGAILAPHLIARNHVGDLVVSLEAATGVLLVLNRARRLAAASMVLLFVGSIAVFGVIPSLEYVNFLGIGLFLFLASAPSAIGASRLRSYAVPVLRIHLGIAFGVLAWTEKLVEPTAAVRLVERYQLNFMNALGVTAFSDRLFVLCAGGAELVLATVFVFGLVTRVNTAIFVAFLLGSNMYFCAVGRMHEALVELTGHLPLFATSLVLMVHGCGDELHASTLCSDLLRHVKRIPFRDIAELPAGALADGA